MNTELFKFPLHLIVHPFCGFWVLKYDRSRKMGLIVSFMILFLLIITNIMQKEYSGFIVNFVYPGSMNSLMEVVYVVVPILFWCVANWSLTTLMDGEGKFVEIFIFTCYALIPMVLIHFPWIWISNVITLQETSYYQFFDYFALLWCVFLLFVGNMTVHQFTPSKTVGTLLLSVVAMGFLAFLSMLFFSLIQEILSFVYTIYQELTLRS